MSSGLDSHFGGLEGGNEDLLSIELIAQVQGLPRRDDITLELFDYDGTLTNDRIRYKIIPRLKGYSGNDAYPVIAEDLGTEDDPTGFNTMIQRLHEYEFVFSNVDDFYDPINPLHHILSAGNHQFQNGKISRSFGETAKRSVVQNAEDKPNEILRIVIALGFVPNVVFLDDKIGFFTERELDKRLQNILGTNVEFLRATADYENNSVLLEERIQRAVSRVLAEA